MTNKLLFTFCVVCMSFCYAQEAETSRLEQLEIKLTAIQDFLNLELQTLKTKVKVQQSRTEKLRKRNSTLLKKIKLLEERVKELETQLLETKANNISKAEVQKDIKEKPEAKPKYKSKKIRSLATELASDNADIRMGAVIKLGSAKSKEAADVLKVALTDKNPYVQVLACKTVAKRKEISALQNLLALLESDHSSVRQHANLALEKITDIKVNFNHTSEKSIRDNKITEWKKKIENNEKFK